MALRIERGSKGVVRIEMARPEVLNAFDEAMIAELEQAFALHGADPGVRAIVLAGQGKAFSAGADIAWMKRLSEADEATNLEDGRRFAGMLHRIATTPKPTIARVHGISMGGGVGLACACDFVIAGEKARFAVTEARFGLTSAVIAPYLVNAVGRRQAQRLALSTAQVGAAEALAIGLVHEIVPEDRLDAAVDALLAQLHASGPRAIAEIKALYASLTGGPITAQMREQSARTVARIRGTDEAKEGFAAFLAKRPPRWIEGK
jgi:methylglutaconyl-CoA hydratase